MTAGWLEDEETEQYENDVPTFVNIISHPICSNSIDE